MQNFILLWVRCCFPLDSFCKNRIIIYLDYVNGGELFTHLNKRQHFSEHDAKLYIAELALALGQLHKVKY
jgi:serine/threonine protein kinase